MPTYTFRCETCGLVFDKFLSFHDDQRQVTCPQGHTTVHRVFRPPAVVFKGSGFYVTDHRGTNSSSKPASKATETKTAAQEKTSAAAAKADSNGGATSGSAKKD